MDRLIFELARLEHARAIADMRGAAGDDLRQKLGRGRWGRAPRVQSIRERIKLGDPDYVRRATLYVASLDGLAVGSAVVSTVPPGFWKREVWREPKAIGLGVFALVVHPRHQRQGVGRFLMQGIESLAQSHDIPFVRLDAYASNPISTGFYRSIGYDERITIDLRGNNLILFEKKVT